MLRMRRSLFPSLISSTFMATKWYAWVLTRNSYWFLAAPSLDPRGSCSVLSSLVLRTLCSSRRIRDFLFECRCKKSSVILRINQSVSLSCLCLWRAKIFAAKGRGVWISLCCLGQRGKKFEQMERARVFFEGLLSCFRHRSKMIIYKDLKQMDKRQDGQVDHRAPNSEGEGSEREFESIVWHLFLSPEYLSWLMKSNGIYLLDFHHRSIHKTVSLARNFSGQRNLTPL